MGSFANTVFSILLGWLQGLVAMIWSALTAEGGDAFLQFIAKNWIIITIFLCAVGVTADFIVYFFRWEPYKVWKTFWRRIHSRSAAERGKEEAPAEPAGPVPGRRYFRPAAETEIPGTVEETMAAETYEGEPEAYEELPEEEYAAGPEEMPAEADDLYRWREQPPEETAAEIPAEVTRAGYRVPADSIQYYSYWIRLKAGGPGRGKEQAPQNPAEPAGRQRRGRFPLCGSGTDC